MIGAEVNKQMIEAHEGRPGGGVKEKIDRPCVHPAAFSLFSSVARGTRGAAYPSQR